MNSHAQTPEIARSVALNFQGDRGGANFHRICSWLCNEFCDRAGPHSRIAIWNGQGGRDSVQAVGRGRVDLAVATPASFVSAALGGTGIFEGESYSGLRALAVMPQDDIMVFALPTEHHIRSFDELREKKPPLKIALAPDDGVNFIGCGAHRLLEAAGITPGVLESWGGGYLEEYYPAECVEAVKRGAADAVVQEAIMGPWWRDLVAARPMTFLSLEPQALSILRERFGWGARTLPANYFQGQVEPVVTLDFADFVIIVRDDMPDDIAHLLTWCLVERRQVIEQQYRHIEPQWSPITYPIVPEKMARTTLPLHAGALKYYREAGIIGHSDSRGERL